VPIEEVVISDDRYVLYFARCRPPDPLTAPSLPTFALTGKGVWEMPRMV